MKQPTFFLLTAFILLSSTLAACSSPKSQAAEGKPKGSVHQFTMETIDGEEQSLEAYKGKVLVMVNVASKCGYTPQYEQLQAFYEKYKDKGVVVMGFPANNFMNQEPGTDEEIKQFCTENYDVSFPMFSKISVKGSDQHPLYGYLTSEKKNGVLDTKVSWNFNKFLVNQDGQVIKHYNSPVEVTSKAFHEDLEALLEQTSQASRP